MADLEEETLSNNNKLLIEAFTAKMEQMMNNKMDTFRDELQQRKSSRRNQEQHEQIPQQKVAQPRRPQEKPNWSSRSNRNEAHHDYYSREDKKSIEQEKQFQTRLRRKKDYDELKGLIQEAFDSVKKSKKKKPVIHQFIGTEATKERPSCHKEGPSIQEPEPNQHLPICKESVVVLQEDAENNIKENMETQPHAAVLDH